MSEREWGERKERERNRVGCVTAERLRAWGLRATGSCSCATDSDRVVQCVLFLTIMDYYFLDYPYYNW